MIDWVTLIGAGLGGGAVAKLIDYLIVKEKNQQEDENNIINLLKEDNRELRAERDIREAQVKSLFEELMQLKQEYTTLREDYIKMQYRITTLEQEHESLQNMYDKLNNQNE